MRNFQCEDLFPSRSPFLRSCNTYSYPIAVAKISCTTVCRQAVYVVETFNASLMAQNSPAVVTGVVYHVCHNQPVSDGLRYTTRAL